MQTEGKQTNAIPRLIIRGWVIGAGLGGMFAALLVLTNTAGLLDLARQSSDGTVAIALLVFGFATLVAALYSATAIMLISSADD